MFFNISFIVTIILIAIFGGIGFGIGTLKIPESSSLQISRKAGGERIDEILLKAIKFKLKKNRIYLYTKEEEK